MHAHRLCCRLTADTITCCRGRPCHTCVHVSCRSEGPGLSRGRSSQPRAEDSACTFAPSINVRSEKMLQVGLLLLRLPAAASAPANNCLLQKAADIKRHTQHKRLMLPVTS